MVRESSLQSSTFLWLCVLCSTCFVLASESVDEILKFDHSNESYCREQYFPVVVFIMLYKVVLTLESVDETLKYDHPNESY